MYGDYGVTVNTEVCGAFDSGSIPDSRPKKETQKLPSGSFCVSNERAANKATHVTFVRESKSTTMPEVNERGREHLVDLDAEPNKYT